MKSIKAKFAVLLLATSLTTTFSQLPDSGGTGSGAMSNPAGAPLDGGIDNTSNTRNLEIEEERKFDSIGERERNLRIRSLDPINQGDELEQDLDSPTDPFIQERLENPELYSE